MFVRLVGHFPVKKITHKVIEESLHKNFGSDRQSIRLRGNLNPTEHPGIFSTL